MTTMSSARRFAIGLALAAGLTATALLALPRDAASADGGPAAGWRGPGARLAAVLSRLDLTDDQKTRIKGILVEERADVDPLMAAAARTRRDLFLAIHAAAFDEDAVRRAAAGAAASEADLAVARARILSRVRGVLTSDQQATLQDMQNRFLSRMEARGRLGMAFVDHAADFVDAL